MLYPLCRNLCVAMKIEPLLKTRSVRVFANDPAVVLLATHSERLALLARVRREYVKLFQLFPAPFLWGAPAPDEEALSGGDVGYDCNYEGDVEGRGVGAGGRAYESSVDSDERRGLEAGCASGVRESEDRLGARGEAESDDGSGDMP